MRSALLLPLAFVALALPVALADPVPVEVAVLTFGAPGLPTATAFSPDGFAWEDVGTVVVPAELTRVFFVRSDFWLEAGVRNVDVCLASPSGPCLTTPGDALKVGGPCVRLSLVCQGSAEGSDIGANAEGAWTLKYSGYTNARTEIRVFAW